MKIYTAAKFARRVHIRPYRDQLWALGHQVVSTWLDEIAKPAGMDQGTFDRKLAIKDLAEISSADLLILDTWEAAVSGGREVEFGFALGRYQEKMVWLVGEQRNIFHTLADRHFYCWEDVVDALHPEV